MAIDSRYPEYVGISVNGKVVDATNPLPTISSGGGGSSVKILDDAGNPITATNRFPTDVTPNSPVATDYLPVRLTDGMNFYTATGGGGGGGASIVDQGTFSEGVTSLTPVGGEFNDSSPALTAGMAAAVRVTSFRAAHTNLRRSDGTEVGTVANPIQVGGTLAVTQSGGWSVAATQSGAWSVTQAGTWNVGLSAGANTVGKVDQGAGGASAWKVDGSAVVQPVKTEVQLDYDSGAGTQNLSLVGLALPGAGGAVAGGTATNPIRVDPTGTTAQPITDNGGSLTVDGTVAVSGTVTVSGTVAVSGTVTVSGTVAATQSGAWSVSAASAFPVTDNGGSLTVDGTVAIAGTVPVSGTVAATQSGGWTVTANAGSGTFAVDQLDSASLDYDSGAGTVNQTVFGLALPGAGGPVAGGTSANPVRVDPTGTTPQPVSDGGGSLTVDGTVAVSGTVTVAGTVGVSGTVTVTGTVASTQSGAWNVGLNAGSNTIGKVDQGAAGASAWKVDGSGVTQPVSGTVSVSGTVTVSGTVAATQSGAWSVSGTGTFTTSQTNATTADYDTGAGTVTQVMFGLALPASGGPVAGGTASNPIQVGGTVAATQSGAWTVAATQSGTWTVGLSTGTNSIGDVRSITTSVVPGTGATHLGKTEDAGHASGDTGVMSLAVRNDTRGTLAGTDLDYAPLQLNSSGDLRVDASAIAQPVTDNGGSLTVDGTVDVGGTVDVSSVAAPTDHTNTNGANFTTSGQSLTVSTTGCSSFFLEIRAVWSGTLSFFVTGDSGNTYAISGLNLATGVLESSTTVNGTWVFPVGSFSQVAVVSSVWVSGSASAKLRASLGVNAVRFASSLPAGTNEIGSVTATESRPGSTTSVVDLLGATDATRVLTILAANASRRGATIRNDTDTALLIREGGSASLTNYTDILPAGARYTLDYPASTGILTAYLPQVPQGRLIATERS